MEVDIINDAEKSVKQQANGGYEHSLRGGQERMDVHVAKGRR